MRVAVGSDHRGFETKEKLLVHLRGLGYDCVDCGCHSKDAVDYPDVAQLVGAAVVRGECERGLLICGTGIGMSIAANKVAGIRAALCHNLLTAQRARQHNDANVICMGSDIVSVELGRNMMDVFLATAFEGGRHACRIDKVKALEMHGQLDT